MFEILNLLAMSGWTGELQVRASAARYGLVLDQGALKSATSGAHEHRLGEILVRKGLLTRSQLEDCLRELGPQRRIGQVLVENGWIEHKQLFQALREQTLRILHDALLVSRGTFVFSDLAEDALPPPISFHMPMSHLLLEAAQRVDEMRLYRTRIESDMVRPALLPAADLAQLDAPSRALAEQIDGRRTVRELAERLDQGEYETTRSLFALLERGVACIASDNQAAETELQTLVDAFDRVLELVFATMRDPSAIAAVHGRVSEWIEATGLGSHLGSSLLPGGRIDRDRLLLATRELGSMQRATSVYQVLQEVCAFTLFAVGPLLVRTHESDLARDVYRRLREIHPPAARKTPPIAF